MSAETLERSVLEGKDREQLVAIASALGIKALSRAKKAEIVDRILEHTGAGPVPAVAVASPLAAPGVSGSSSARNGNGLTAAAAQEAPAAPAATARPPSSALDVDEYGEP